MYTYMRTHIRSMNIHEQAKKQEEEDHDDFQSLKTLHVAGWIGR